MSDEPKQSPCSVKSPLSLITNVFNDMKERPGLARPAAAKHHLQPPAKNSDENDNTIQDEDEDEEVFIGSVITNREKSKRAKLRRKTELFKPNFRSILQDSYDAVSWDDGASCPEESSPSKIHPSLNIGVTLAEAYSQPKQQGVETTNHPCLSPSAAAASKIQMWYRRIQQSKKYTSAMSVVYLLEDKSVDILQEIRREKERIQLCSTPETGSSSDVKTDPTVQYPIVLTPHHHLKLIETTPQKNTRQLEQPCPLLTEVKQPEVTGPKVTGPKVNWPQVTGPQVNQPQDNESVMLKGRAKQTIRSCTPTKLLSSFQLEASSFSPNRLQSTLSSTQSSSLRPNECQPQLVPTLCTLPQSQVPQQGVQTSSIFSSPRLFPMTVQTIQCLHDPVTSAKQFTPRSTTDQEHLSRLQTFRESGLSTMSPNVSIGKNGQKIAVVTPISGRTRDAATPVTPGANHGQLTSDHFFPSPVVMVRDKEEGMTTSGYGLSSPHVDPSAVDGAPSERRRLLEKKKAELARIKAQKAELKATLKNENEKCFAMKQEIQSALRGNTSQTNLPVHLLSLGCQGVSSLTLTDQELDIVTRLHTIRNSRVDSTSTLAEAVTEGPATIHRESLRLHWHSKLVTDVHRMSSPSCPGEVARPILIKHTGHSSQFHRTPTTNQQAPQFPTKTNQSRHPSGLPCTPREKLTYY